MKSGQRRIEPDDGQEMQQKWHCGSIALSPGAMENDKLSTAVWKLGENGTHTHTRAREEESNSVLPNAEGMKAHNL